MDTDLSDKLNRVLSDPDAMAKVMEMAGSLFAASPSPAQAEQQTQVSPALPDLSALLGKGEGKPSEGGGDSDRIALLRALCPYLSPQRRDAAMSMMRILGLLQMAEKAGVLSSLGMFKNH